MKALDTGEVDNRKPIEISRSLFVVINNECMVALLN